MNLQSKLLKLQAEEAKLLDKIRKEEKAAKRRRKALQALPRKVGLSSIAELIGALQSLERDSKARRKGKKRKFLKPAKKKALMAEAIKEGADRKALARKYGCSANSIAVWVSQARKAKKA